MFRRLRTKLTVLYSGLLTATLMLIGVIVLTAVSDNAQQVVRRDLSARNLVFERVWAHRSAQLQNDAVLLSRDFGFRSAVASHDDPTIRSALANLKTRLGIDEALMIAGDGRVIAAGEKIPSLRMAALHALKGDEAVSGVLTMDGAPYETVSVPVSADVNHGWSCSWLS
jgi:hypothetical protein